MIYKMIKDWIMSIALIVVFMTLVEMIVPSNNFKKYIKFVTGLIVIITIMAPVFKIFAKNINTDAYISKYLYAFNEGTQNQSKESNIKNNYNNQVIEEYKENLIKKIESEIMSNTQKNYKVSSIEIISDMNSKDFGQIKCIALKKSDENKGKIKQVDKIVINSNSKEVNNSELCDTKVTNLLKNEFGIDPSKVYFTK